MAASIWAQTTTYCNSVILPIDGGTVALNSGSLKPDLFEKITGRKRLEFFAQEAELYSELASANRAPSPEIFP